MNDKIQTICVFFIWASVFVPCSSLNANKIEKPINFNPVSGINALAATPQLSNELVQLKKLPYDDETYQLTYKTLIYNSHILDAYNLALIAVNKQPDDISWHEKLAQTATWVGDYNTGMKEWLYVAQHSQNSDTLKKAANIAKLLGYDIVSVAILKIYLANKPTDIAETINLAYAENRINKPEEALSTLKKLNATQPTRASYELMANIYQDIDQWDNALITWDKINKHFGPTIQTIMAQAKIYYTQKKFPQALLALKQGVTIAKSTDTEFWRTLAMLAWLLNNKPLAILGYAHFSNEKSSLFNLIELERLSHPEKALAYSLKGWNKFKQMDFFSNALYLASQDKRWDIVNELFNNLTPEQAHKAQSTLGFWEVKANMYGALGANDLQINILTQGIKRHPEMKELRVNLLFVLMNRGDLRWVKLLMQDGYENNLWRDSVSWKVYADAFSVLNKFYAALIMYQENLFENLQYDQLLIDYSHILEKIKLDQQAYNLWEYLWNRTLDQLEQTPSFNKKIYQTLSQVAPYFVSGTLQVQLLNTLFYSDLDEQDMVIILNWIVPRNYFELITYFKSYYFNNILPAWAGTNLALAHNDLPTLQQMLEHANKSWSRGDLINAAVRMENTPLAVDLAFAELTERPSASEIYTEFTQYGLANANFVSAGEEYEKFVNVAGPRTKIETKFRLTNTWRMRPSISLWRVHSTAPNTITNVPNEDILAKVKFDQKIHRGKIIYNLGYRKDLNGFIPASIDAEYKIAAKWTALIKLGYNQENFQNAYMREGGVQDQANIGLLGNLTKYDSIILQLQGLNYYSQDRHYLADGFILEGLYEHKLWLTYPDYTIGLFGNIYQFNRNGSFGGDVTTLFPTLTPDIQTNPNLLASANEAYYQELIPNNYSEGGFNFSFGNTILEYTHAWRPYLWASLYYNSVTALSNDIKIGINGSLFGRDSLLIYGERGTALSTQNQTNYMLGMRYMLYY
jgi:predicted Zn-dependent protease